MPRLILFALSSSLAVACSSAPHPAAAPTAPPSAAPTPAAPAPVVAAPAPVAPATVKHIAITEGRNAGSSTVTTAPDGTMTLVFDMVENGRGPHADSTVRIAPDGTIASLTAKGHHVFGATFEASFERTGDHARWKSTEETGGRDVQGTAFYFPIAWIPEVSGWLVAAALHNGGSLPLLPSGTAHVEKVAEEQISAGGTTRTVAAYRVTGIGLSAGYTWMNPDGSWFGDVSEDFSIVPEGWEGVVRPLVGRQRDLIRAADAKLARELAHRPPAAGLAYTHARVLDVERGRWLADHTVVVVGDAITAVGPSRSLKIPAGAEVVDLAGKALVPGLVDMHQHLGDDDGVLDIASGVTTGRDVGNDPDKLDDYQRRYDEGSAIGPHVVRYGFIEGRNPKAASSKVTAETPDEALAGVKFFVDRHYDGIKIYNSIRPELVPIIAQAAHKAGLPVTGHIPVHMLANEAVRAGYDGIEHINMLLLNFLATHETDTRDTTRFTLIGERAGEFDLQSSQMRSFIQLLLDHKTIIDPTDDAFEDLFVGEQGKILPGLESMVARLPVTLQRGFLSGGLPLDGDKHARYMKAYDKLLALTKLLYERKVRLVLGTDALAGLMFHHEMELFARAGIPNAAILRMATVDPARYLGRDKQVGTIAPGKRADLVVIDGDPLARISDIGRTVTTMRAGVSFPTAELYRAISVEPYAAASR